MSHQDQTADHGGPDAPHRRYDRYEAIADEDGTLVVYDSENHDGWVRSDHSRSLEEMR